MKEVIFGTQVQDGLPYVTMLPPQHAAYRLYAILHEIGVWLGICRDAPQA